VKSAHQILHDYWGYTSFRQLQEDIVQSVVNARDTVALLPTGGGKSVCFQVPAMMLPGICIVLSPLVALMGDQVAALKEKGIKALAIAGGITTDELVTLLDNARFGKYKFLYLSPERLQQELVQEAIRQMNVNLIAVDEAHCISQWGNDFRPAYKNITVLRELHPYVPIIALTATATPQVLDDTIASLNLELPAVFKASFVRDNLSYQVFKEEDKLYRMEQLLKENPQSAIVYVRSRKATIETSNQLDHLGIRSTYFHGGLPPSEKKKRLEAWKQGTFTTMVATNAFGMGIDHPHVRYVIHTQLPESMESYFQEAGRAGRDGNPARAVLLYQEYDKELVRKQFVEALPTPKQLKKLYRKLNTYFQVSYGEGEFTSFSFNVTEFCQTYQLNTLWVYNGLQTLDRLGIVQLSREFGQNSMVQFVVPTGTLLQYFERNALASVIGKTLLRIYGGIFEMPTKVNLDLIAKKTGQSVSTVIDTLKTMKRDDLLELELKITDATLTFMVPREDERTINVVTREVTQLNQKKEAQVAAVLRYVDNTKECRMVQLVSYFGETTAQPCGICSVCATTQSLPSQKETVLIAEQITALLEENARTSRELAETLTFAEPKILHVLRLLMERKKVRLNFKNQYEQI
jgi:ATP-dependent DNA helicase RecQ